MSLSIDQIVVGGVYEGGSWLSKATCEVIVITNSSVLLGWSHAGVPNYWGKDRFAKWATQRIDEPKERV